jgi:hypothetical protein
MNYFSITDYPKTITNRVTMPKAKIIWFDMTITTRHGEVSQKFLEYFDIQYSAHSRNPEDEPALTSGLLSGRTETV